MLLELDLMIIGTCTIIFLLFHWIVGLKIISTYFHYKQPSFLHVGIGWIGASMVWIGVVIDFLSLLLFDVPTPLTVHLLVIGGALPFTQLAWVAGITSLTMDDESTRKKLLIIGTIIALIFSTVYIYFSITNPIIWGEKITPIQVKLSFYNQLHYAVEIMVFMVPALWFSKKSLSSANPEIKLKGKVLTFTFVLSIVMTSLELLSTGVLIYLIARTMAVIVSILFYLGFMLPSWFKDMIIKKE